MAPLGPFGAAPRLAVGVSGGPHSLALALLADGWARARGGGMLALVADHGLRPESGEEAETVAARLAGRGIAARVLRLGLAPGGVGVQARARAARMAALLAACREVGTPWLLLGHHRGDQAETLLHRAAAGSGPAGLAAMAPVRAAPEALVLRPLLGVAPARLEALLAAEGLDPVRDPSNEDARFARVRLRRALADPGGTGPEVAALAEAAAAFARRRTALEAAVAARLAAGAAVLHPEGWAAIDPDLLGRDAVAGAALAALLRVVGGAARFAPAPSAVAALLRAGQGTLGGAWLRGGGPGGRPGGRLLLLREPAGAAEAPWVAARPGAVWDGRFRLVAGAEPGVMIGALGPAEAARIRRLPAWRRTAAALPAAALASLPAAWRRAGGEAPPDGAPAGGQWTLAAVPGLLYPDGMSAARFAMLSAPVTGPVTVDLGPAAGHDRAGGAITAARFTAG